MKSVTSLREYVNDRLVTRWYDLDTHRTYSQGKRVPDDCPLNELERRIYVKNGAVQCLKMIRANRPNLSFGECWDLLRRARGTNTAKRRFT